MAKLPPERLAKALRANLKRRKQAASAPLPARSAKDPEKLKENPSRGSALHTRETPPR